MPEQITLYGHGYSPYCISAYIAFDEAGVDYTHHVIDVTNKPAWFIESVNPVGKIPAITYGGPSVPPDQPSPESRKISESRVIADFVADLNPAAHLVPADLLARVDMRLAILDWVHHGLGVWSGVFSGPRPTEDLFVWLEDLQRRLPPTGFVAGTFSLADIVMVPFLKLPVWFWENGLAKGDGKKYLEMLQEPKFARLRKYLEDLDARPSVQRSWDVEALLERWPDILKGN
ncbi:thioredoxin-like protein [Epithele typhae]|uniref:thioredoxin-like protein n=1 Tax=Epithele typhae TaxID=378194 RepID=UPI002007F659|nr:thioredoxin-like protein [Epithele typhae]KAH9930449.1 thioredoxin-like protein [Epithele typhae]